MTKNQLVLFAKYEFSAHQKSTDNKIDFSQETLDCINLLKLCMPYYDVSIPLKLKNLTYYYDKDEDLTGFAVRVPLKNKFYDGIVIKKTEKPLEIEQIKSIDTVWGQAYTRNFIEFLQWMSFYYIAEIGTILRLTFFEEITDILKGKKKRKRASTQSSDHADKTFFENLAFNQETVSKIIQAFCNQKYKAFLLHSPNIAYEIKILLQVLDALSTRQPKSIYTQQEGTMLFILPEIRDVETVYQLIKDKFDNKVVKLHSEMKPSELFASIEKIMHDEAKVVVGTRFAIFAPVKKLSLVMLSQESSWLYKAEEPPRYHTRECALMRGFIEECPVVLSSSMPSVFSYFNVIRRKIELIDDFSCLPHPKIKILRQPFNRVFHQDVSFYLKLYEKENLLVISPRTGYSLLRCNDCGEIIRCEICGYSMIYQKEVRGIECFRCNLEQNAPLNCPYCSGISLQPIGAGVERLKEELSKLVADKQISIGELDFESTEIKGIYVAHAGKIRKTYSPIFKCAVFVDFDLFLSLPDYQAVENAFAKVLTVSQMLKDDGFLFIQTRSPENEIFRYIRRYNFKDFYHYELKHRHEVNFPPFVRIIKLIVKIKRANSTDTVEKLKNLLKYRIYGETIGPLKGQGRDEFIFILRSRDKKRFTEEANHYLDEIKNIKGISYKIEVDPVSFS